MTAQTVTRNGRTTIVVDLEAFEDGRIGGNDPAELAKLLSMADLRRMVERMPGTLEGETARRRDRQARGPLKAGTRHCGDPGRRRS